MKRFALILAAALAVTSACSAPEPPEKLAQTTDYALAREHGKYVEVNGLDIFTISMGQGSDVILLHGNPASTYTWHKVLEPLAKTMHVHAIDLPGFGMSAKPADAPYTPEYLASFVIGYMDAAGIQHATVVGNSMGGHIATEAAIRAPDRIRGLVLLDPSGLPLAGEEKAGGDMPLTVRMLEWPVIGPLLQRLPSRWLLARQLRSNVHDPSILTDADIDGYYRPLRTENGLVAFFKRSEQAVPAERRDRVKTIKAPALILQGADDTVVPREIARAYQELIPVAELEILPDCGHLPQEEKPEKVIAEIQRWVEDYPPDEDNT